MSKIKVAMLCTYPLNENKIYGGVETHVYHLTHHIALLSDIELHIVTLGTNKKQFLKNNIYFHIIKKSNFRYVRPLDMIKLRREILKINPDIVHVQGTSYMYSLPATLVRGKHPTLLTVHGLVKMEFKFEKGVRYATGKFISKPLEKYAISKIQSIIVCSPAMKELVNNMTNSKIYVIPNGINLERIDDVQSIDLNHPNIFFVGLLRKVKGIGILLNAIPIIKKSISDICVYIAGSGQLENELKSLVKKLDIEENVKFLGFLQEEEKYIYYKSADLCVVPSVYESFGIVLLEAMAYGKPVVASNVGGIPYVVENGTTGLLFECGNVKELAEKIIVLLRDEELRKKMGEAGRERAKEFTWDKIAEQTVDLYNEILSEHN